MTRAFRVVQRNALVYRRVWYGSVFSNFLQPTLYLFAMGLGLGGLVDADRASLPAGVSFLQFLAPGLLAATCMQTAAFEASWPVAGKMTWHFNYEAMASTPLRIGDLVAGELLWIALRLTTVATAFGLVMLPFGALRPIALLPSVAGAVLTGVAFAAPILAYACTLKSDGDFNVMFRFGITPMFLFSGVFFPIDRLPDALQAVAWLTPLFHGVELVRGLALGTLDRTGALIHAGYLGLLTVGGLVAARWTFRSRLHP